MIRGDMYHRESEQEERGRTGTKRDPVMGRNGPIFAPRDSGSMPKSQKPDGAVAGSSKRLASRFYQIKTGHCLTGQYLN